MTLYQTLDSYANDSALLRSPKFHCPVHRAIDDSRATADVEGNKIFPSGYFVAESANGMGRIAPRSKVTTVVTASAPTIAVRNAMPFIAGDVLVVPAPYARLDLALVWANGDAATITIAGQAITHTVAGFSSLTALAVAIATQINTTPAYRGRVEAIAENQFIHLYAADGRYHTIAVAESTAGSGTITLLDSASVFRSNLAVGTIATGGVNTATNTLTLTGNASQRIPIGGYVGTADKVLGLLLRSIDVVNEPAIQGLCTEAELRADTLPYWDGEIAFTLPDLKVY